MTRPTHPTGATRHAWFRRIATAAAHAAHAALELRDRDLPLDDGDLCDLAHHIGRAMAAREDRIDAAGATLCEVREEIVAHLADTLVGRDSSYTIPDAVTSDFTIALFVIDQFLEERARELLELQRRDRWGAF